MKFYSRIIGGLCVGGVFLAVTVCAEDRGVQSPPIPTNPYRADNEKVMDEKVQALEDFLLKRKNEQEAKPAPRKKKIEIIYPPSSTAQKAEKPKIETRAVVLTPKAEKTASIAKNKTIDVVVNGKKYESLRSYKLGRLKDLLKESFFQANIEVDLFTEEELLSLIRDLKSDQNVQARDSLGEMKKMMAIYNRKNGNEMPLSVDLNKIKTIVIEPKKKSLK